MKKTILPLLAVALFAGCSDSKKDQEIQQLKEEIAYMKGAADAKSEQDSVAAEQPAQPAADPAQPAAEQHSQPAAAQSNKYSDFEAYGSISSYGDAHFYLRNGRGQATFGDQTRQLRYESYNPSNGQFIVGAYYGGSYIGQYIGRIRDNVYSGKFHNYKNGGKVDFYLMMNWD